MLIDARGYRAPLNYHCNYLKQCVDKTNTVGVDGFRADMLYIHFAISILC